jgi:hypothetical protein
MDLDKLSKRKQAEATNAVPYAKQQHPQRERERESTFMEQHTDTVTCKFKPVRPKHVLARPATKLLQD